MSWPHALHAFCVYNSYMHTHMPALAHRVSRPRGTGSVGDSVGECARTRSLSHGTHGTAKQDGEHTLRAWLFEASDAAQAGQETRQTRKRTLIIQSHGAGRDRRSWLRCPRLHYRLLTLCPGGLLRRAASTCESLPSSLPHRRLCQVACGVRGVGCEGLTGHHV